jgi:hypothetical protein
MDGMDSAGLYKEGFLPSSRYQVPKGVAFQVEERHGQVATPAGWHDLCPVACKQLSKFRAELDEV